MRTLGLVAEFESNIMITFLPRQHIASSGSGFPLLLQPQHPPSPRGQSFNSMYSDHAVKARTDFSASTRAIGTVRSSRYFGDPRTRYREVAESLAMTYFGFCGCPCLSGSRLRRAVTYLPVRS